MQYTSATTARPPSSYPVLDTTREVRFAVVIYGGVALAIYINGVAQELYRMVRATAEVKQDNAGHRWPAPGNRLDGTERVYRKLSYPLSHDHLLQQYREHVEKMDDYRRQLEIDDRDASKRKQLLEARRKAIPDPLEKTINTAEQPIRTRFIVDILSGTSAGGINAIYLAKALANDQQVIPLKDLWVHEGDLALLRASTGLSVHDAIGKALEPLGASVVKTRLEEIMRLSLTDDELVDFMQKGYEVNRQLDPKPMLNSMSRATQIIGKMFENIADANALDGKQLAWIARLGQVFWGLVAVAVPHSMANLLIFHWLKLLYLFGALVIVGSVLLGQPEVQRFGWTAVGVTAASNVCVLLLRDYMRGRHRWLRAFVVLVCLTVIFLAAIGADELFNLALRARLRAILQGVMGWM